MKTVVICMQEENWEDDAGGHDPALVTISDADFEVLKTFEKLDVLTHTQKQQVDAMCDGPYPIAELPCTLHGVFSFWFSYCG